MKTKASTTRCIICDSVGLWKNVDQYRQKAHGMAMCTQCGFITYPEIVSDHAKMVEYYREEYREPPTYQNLLTGERKLHYHDAFLAPLFEEWRKTGKTSPKICEVGAAFGLALTWFRKQFPASVSWIP
jgi:hypothetical protein